MAPGLDRDDTIIRRRLRQKLEFLVEDTIDATPPTDAELEAWLAAHPDPFRREPRLTFRQVYLSPDRRKGAAGSGRAEAPRGASRAGPNAADRLRSATR